MYLQNMVLVGGVTSLERVDDVWCEPVSMSYRTNVHFTLCAWLMQQSLKTLMILTLETMPDPKGQLDCCTLEGDCTAPPLLESGVVSETGLGLCSREITILAAETFIFVTGTYTVTPLPPLYHACILYSDPSLPALHHVVPYIVIHFL